MKIYTKQTNCYVFDFDDTLVRTYAIIYVIKNERVVRSLSSKTYSNDKLNDGEHYNYSEFRDPQYIWQGTELPTFKTLHNINNAIKEQRSNSVVYILTAREKDTLDTMHEFFVDRGIICIPKDHILTIGDKKHLTTPEAKRQELQKLLDHGYDVIFFDDDENNIKIANQIEGVKTRHMRDDDI